MKIGMLSTINTNVGDDLIRDGIIYLLDQLYDDYTLKVVNKHRPETMYPIWHPSRYTNRGRRTIAKIYDPSAFDDCNLLIQAGTPAFWPEASRSEWTQFYYRDAARARKRGARVVNLGVGSCFVSNDPTVDKQDSDFYRHLLSVSHLTTVRDWVAKKICGCMGFNVPMIPCPALLAASAYGATADPKNVILINYMHGGGHFWSWDYRNNPKHWESVVRDTILRLQQDFEVVFLCHDRRDKAVVEKTFPGHPIRLTTRPYSFFLNTRDAVTAICNRIHAAVGMAGMGIPSLVVGNDTRTGTIDAIGLQYMHTLWATSDMLYGQILDIIEHRTQLSEKLLAAAECTKMKYMDELKHTLGIR